MGLSKTYAYKKNAGYFHTKIFLLYLFFFSDFELIMWVEDTNEAARVNGILKASNFDQKYNNKLKDNKDEELSSIQYHESSDAWMKPVGNFNLGRRFIFFQ